jgi:hypothetical protein
MRFAALFGVRRQAQVAPTTVLNDLAPTGSWTAFTLASIAAAALVFSAGAQNVSYAWALGLARSEFSALALGAAAAGATLLGPFCWLVVFRGRGLGTRACALLLALGCALYASISSLGFVAGSKDLGISERLAVEQRNTDKRVLVDAIRNELGALRGQRSDIVDRRSELTAMLLELAKAAPVERPTTKPDSQASAVGYYLRAAGYAATDEAVSIWLTLGMTAFLEFAAALSLTVAAALKPERRKPEPAAPSAAQPWREEAARPTAARAEQPREQDEDRGDPPPPRPRGRLGRAATVLPDQAIARLRNAGGRADGSLTAVGKLLGTKSKTTAHRLLHRMAEAGMVHLSATPHGISVALN